MHGFFTLSGLKMDLADALEKDVDLNTIEYLGVWEKIHNPECKPLEFEGFKNEAGANSFLMSPKKWILSTNAIGIVSKSGRYGGTYAHSDIAFKFASWLSVEFELYLVQDYQRLKAEEGARLSLDWSARREIAKSNYRIHTDAIKENLIPPALPHGTAKRIYANEADVLNIAMFGMTAQEWRTAHPEASVKENVRDYADIYQLLVLSNLESLNAEFIKANMPQNERLKRLNDATISQMKSVLASPSAKRLADKDSNSLQKP